MASFGVCPYAPGIRFPRKSGTSRSTPQAGESVSAPTPQPWPCASNGRTRPACAICTFLTERYGLCVRDTYWGTAVPDKDAVPGKVYEHVYFRSQSRVMRDITIYLAFYSPVKVLEIGLDKNAAIEAASPFAVAAPGGHLRHFDYSGGLRQPSGNELSGDLGAS